MSLYRRANSAVWSYDFIWKGRRFSGSTGCTGRREAEAVLRREKARVKASTTVHRPGDDISVEAAFSRYWDACGRYHARPDETDRDLGWLAAALGRKRGLSTITNPDVAALVARRRGEGLSNASVNRYVIERLRAVMLMARDEWDVPVRGINWKKLRLAEPKIRVREMSAAEEAAMLDALAPAYRPLVRFAVLSGLRLEELVSLEWRQVDWRERTITLTGKGGKQAMIPLSRAMHGIIRPLPRTDPAGRVFGLEYQAVKSAWRRARARAGIEGLRFHDLRHTCATRLVRASGNLLLAQTLLRHDDIGTTTRYAHATMADLRTAMDAASAAASPTRTPTQDKA